MISSIHIALQVIKKVESLAGVGKKEQTIIDSYLEIIDYLQKGTVGKDKVLLKRTRYGEHRIANCLKYNLGLGYRLVTIKKRSTLFISFLGTHEETDLWLRKNTNYLPSANDKIYQQSLLVNQSDIPTSLQKHEDASEPSVDEYESKLLNKVDENTLKDIFCGLYASQER